MFISCLSIQGWLVAVLFMKVEIFRDNSWTTVCDDGWDSTDADVFCRQIGYPGAEFSYGLAQFGEGSGTIQIRNVACTGTETDIRDCTFSTDANTACSHSEDAGVRCLRNISEAVYCTIYCTYNNICRTDKQYWSSIQCRSRRGLQK